MNSRTLDRLLADPVDRRAVYAVQNRLGLSDTVMYYAFWHLDQKHAGKLPGTLKPVFEAGKTTGGRAGSHIEMALLWTDTEQYVEMVVELVQMDLLVGQANRLRVTEREDARRRLLPGWAAANLALAGKKPRSALPRAHIVRGTQRQEIASRWKVVTTRRSNLAEDSSNWDHVRILAMQESIRAAVEDWQSAVDALKPV